MDYYQPLTYDNYYHVYNHGNNQDNIFLEEKNYYFFLEKVKKHLFPVIEIYCYNLLINHFHFLVKVRSEQEIAMVSENWCKEKNIPFKMLDVSKQFSNFFNSYSKSMNKVYFRRGSLFNDRFKRIQIENDNRFSRMIGYIHTNAQHHKLVRDFREWPFSSYHQILENNNSFVNSEAILKWFENKNEFERFHIDFSKSFEYESRWIE